MPKLNRFQIRIETGKTGTQQPVYFTINNHKVPFEECKGDVGPGQTFESGFDVSSFAHSMTLVGPEAGTWDIDKIKVDFDCEGTQPYSATFGHVELDEATEVNIWQDPPLPTWDV
ncbi:helicase [Nitrospina watsonii]|uniref:Helicase n=1 Tax=Nitrospina watsonii TaxID=1323948 RepID=A0ABN8W2D3_9BACT|nr:helicase [Nitrospina watsonii]CAI2718121.1 Helicase [Nitrospina watsonii]